MLVLTCMHSSFLYLSLSLFHTQTHSSSYNLLLTIFYVTKKFIQFICFVPPHYTYIKLPIISFHPHNYYIIPFTKLSMFPSLQTPHHTSNGFFPLHNHYIIPTPNFWWFLPHPQTTNTATLYLHQVSNGSFPLITTSYLYQFSDGSSPQHYHHIISAPIFQWFFPPTTSYFHQSSDGFFPLQPLPLTYTNLPKVPPTTYPHQTSNNFFHSPSQPPHHT